jgi:hypothetical protein
MPSTVVPGVVVDAGASGAPASSGIPSGPSGCDVEVVLAVPAGVLLEALAAAPLDALALELVLLLPQALTAQAAISAITVQTRRAGIRPRTVAGDARW